MCDSERLSAPKDHGNLIQPNGMKDDVVDLKNDGLCSIPSL